MADDSKKTQTIADLPAWFSLIAGFLAAFLSFFASYSILGYQVTAQKEEIQDLKKTVFELREAVLVLKTTIELQKGR